MRKVNKELNRELMEDPKEELKGSGVPRGI